MTLPVHIGIIMDGINRLARQRVLTREVVHREGVEYIRRGAESCIFFSSRRRHTRLQGDWSSDVCSSDLSTLGEFASRITGSSDLYQGDGRHPIASINFVTAHDGFTLRDLVSYNEKHNETNLEDNRDGTDDNRSWNCGIEGPTDDSEVNTLRARQQRNFLVTLLLSQRVPMLVGGEEMRDESSLTLLNASHEGVAFKLPTRRFGPGWTFVLASAEPEREEGSLDFPARSLLEVEPRSTVVLRLERRR